MFRASIPNLLGEKITILVLICFFALPVQAKYGGGTGEPNDPYLIYDANQMNAIGAVPNDWDKCLKLMADIDLSAFTGTSFNIIGTRYDPFTGVFDGNGHTISNFTYTSTGTNCIGFFGYIEGANAEIKNLGLIDPDVNAGVGDYVGSLIGILGVGSVSNCNVEGGSISGGEVVGGLVGLNYAKITTTYSITSVFGNTNVGGLVGQNCGTITNCYSNPEVSGYERVGGLVGYNRFGTIINCQSNGDVSGIFNIGGLVGYNSKGAIANCDSSGDVSGQSRVGGLVGSSWGNIINCCSTSSVAGSNQVGGLVGVKDYGTITNCYSTSSVDANGYVGGLVGSNLDGIIINSYCNGEVTGNLYVGGLLGAGGGTVNCFWDIETSGQSSSNGGTGKTTTEMKTASTFFGWNGCEEIFWILDEGNDYPRLLWEGTPGQELPEHQLSDFLEGNGTPDEPYLIYTAEELNLLGLFVCEWDKQFLLVNDIDLSQYSGTEFNLIGNPCECFAGVFDGNHHAIQNFTWTSSEQGYIGLFRCLDKDGQIKNLAMENIDVNATNGDCVGVLVGVNRGRISDCYSAGSVSGNNAVGGLLGINYETVNNCYSTSSVQGGYWYIGGLVGLNGYGTISECCASGSISEGNRVGGLVGGSISGKITKCYSSGSISGNSDVGGLMGYEHLGTITNCYATGSASGNYQVGGLVGDNYNGTVSNSFWDIETSGQTTSDGGTGLPTAQMQMQVTFTDAGWDFNTPVWIIDEGFDYPRLWWELVPMLHAEPDITLGTSNAISWEPVAGDMEYYAECAEDENFTSIVHNSGWITEKSCEFTDLQIDQRYWYSVKARNTAGVETNWSNVESSLQCSLSGAVDIILDPSNLRSENLKKPYINKINIAQEMIDNGNFTSALSKLENDILTKTDGCAETGEPDKSDWIITCEEQNDIYPLIIETIEYIKGLLEQSAE